MTSENEKPVLPNHEADKDTHLEMLDEEVELEFGDNLAIIQDLDSLNTPENRSYFQELLRLQAELVKLKDWVAHHKKKVVVIFEGRDSAGKGGAIKRITQRLNPLFAVWCPCQRPATANAHNGIFSVMSRIYRQAVKSCYSTVLGITAPVLNVSWAFARKPKLKTFSKPFPNSNGCW